MRATARVGLPERNDLLHRGPGLNLVMGMHHGLDRDGIPRVHRELGRFVGIKPSPLRRFQGGGQLVTLGPRRLLYFGGLQLCCGAICDEQQANSCKHRDH